MLSFVYVVQCKSTSSRPLKLQQKLSVKTKSAKSLQAVTIKYKIIILGLILHLNVEKIQNVTTLQLIQVHEKFIIIQ